MTEIELLSGLAFTVTESYDKVSEKFRLSRARNVGTKKIEVTDASDGKRVTVSIYALATWKDIS